MYSTSFGASSGAMWHKQRPLTPDDWVDISSGFGWVRRVKTKEALRCAEPHWGRANLTGRSTAAPDVQLELLPLKLRGFPALQQLRHQELPCSWWSCGGQHCHLGEEENVEARHPDGSSPAA